MKAFGRIRQKGNTLAEYALPIALVVVASGVIAGTVNIQVLMPQFFAEAGGASVSGSKVIGTYSGKDTEGQGQGNGGGFGAALDGRKGETATLLGLAGIAAPEVEVAGGQGTNLILAMLWKKPLGMDVDGDADFKDESTYVAMVKDLAITTATADEAAASGGSGVIDQYEKAVAAKSNSITQYAYDNPGQVINNGGIKGLAIIDENVDDTQEDLSKNDTDNVDKYGQNEKDATKGDKSAYETTSEVRLALFDNLQYVPIESSVFSAWRAKLVKNEYDGQNFDIQNFVNDNK